MGVDYYASYGIGFKVNFESDNEEYESLYEYLEENLNDGKYRYFEVGSGSYTGQEDDVYIVIKEPFKDGYNNIESLGKELRQHLKELGLFIHNELDVVGGLRVC